MILFILCSLIGGFVAFRKRIKGEKIFAHIWIIAVGVVMGLFVALFIEMAAYETLPHTTQRIEKEKVQLVNLGDSSEIHGSFLLATGSIGTEQYYKFYYETVDGGRQFSKILAEKAVVYEEERKDAYMLEEGKRKVFSEEVHLWLIPKLLCKPQWRYKIYVPRGAIKVEYKLDLR